MHRRCCLLVTRKRWSSTASWSPTGTTSCKHSLVLLRMGESIGRNMLSWLKLLIKLLLLHLVGYLYYFITTGCLNQPTFLMPTVPASWVRSFNHYYFLFVIFFLISFHSQLNLFVHFFLWQLFVKATRYTRAVFNVLFDSWAVLRSSYRQDEVTERSMKP